MNVPNVAQEGYSVADDERRMFKRADEFAEEFDASGHIHQDQELEQYLNDLSQSLLSEQQKVSEIKIGVKVVNDPSLNAASLPNGRIYIHSGMLAAMDNEAQLAALLGHEMPAVTGMAPIQLSENEKAQRTVCIGDVCFECPEKAEAYAASLISVEVAAFEANRKIKVKS